MIEYKGNGMPVKPDTIVVCTLRCGLLTKPVKAGMFDWVHGYRNQVPHQADIVAYEIK